MVHLEWQDFSPGGDQNAAFREGFQGSTRTDLRLLKPGGEGVMTLHPQGGTKVRR